MRKNIDMELKGTPCEDVVAEKQISVITSGVRSQFPNVGVLDDTGAESFIGFAIFDRKGDAIGIITAFGREREFTEPDIKVLQTIGEMVASEFERLDEEKEKEQMREQLFQAHKMEAIGTLAGGIAHDFNNMLQGILGHASLIKAQIPQDHPLFDSVDTIEHISDRAAQLTMQLLGFARKGNYVIEQISINDIVRNVLKIISKTFDRKIEIRTDLGQDVFAMEGDKSQIEQVIMNLCLNARDAMPHGGTLNIETFNRTAVSLGLPQASPAILGNQVILRISDTGVGMSDEVKDHIFEPFFTTKELGKGTGMGLAMVYGVITSHSGSITVDSMVGRGTTFTVSFPAVEQDNASEDKPSPAIAHGKGTILVVDDEEYIRNILRNMLEKLGYKVLLAANGKEAVDTYAKDGERIDLVILDLIMPVMSGREAYEQLMRMNSGVKVLVASGHSTAEQSDFFARQNSHAFIQKPFKMHDISAKVQALLSA
jgi:signal transduction histidine kinase/CheY-like chemotaxis protein